ncbi:MAG: NAD(P)H-hydrate epimerase, partial [Chloroflexi bacterium RBG_13_56_8]
MKLVTSDEMRNLEQEANDAGLTYATMMERAGHAVALAIRDRVAATPGQILVLVGPGNNGGDGLVAARYLCEWGHQVTVYLWKRNLDEDPNLRLAQERDIPILSASEDEGFQQLVSLVRDCDVLIDALLGIGITGVLRDGLPELLGAAQQVLHECKAQPSGETTPLRGIREAHPQATESAPPLVVAVDMPSGLNSDTGKIDERSLAANITVTFAYPKRGHLLFPGARWVGELLVADIGIPPNLAEGLL